MRYFIFGMVFVVAFFIAGFFFAGNAHAQEVNPHAQEVSRETLVQALIVLLTQRVEELQAQLAIVLLEEKAEALEAKERKECDRIGNQIQTLEHDLMQFDVETKAKLVDLARNARGETQYAHADRMNAYRAKRAENRKELAETIDMLKNQCQ